MSRYLLLFLLLTPSLLAQAYQVKGVVRNLQGQGIPYVSVYLQNSSYGTLTNVKGAFLLKLEAGKHTLVFQHIGHRQQVITIEVRRDTSLDVVMESQDIQIEAVEIQGGKEDPAYAIMEEVIAHKKDFIHQFDTYTCQTYIKATLEKDTLPNEDSGANLGILIGMEEESDSLKANREQLELIESVSQTYFKTPGTYKSVVKAYRDLAGKMSSSGASIRISDQGTLIGGGAFEEVNNPYLFYTDVSDADINFYRNLVDAKDLGDRPFVSPLNSTLWRLTYSYRLEDKFYENNRVVYKIFVNPKNSAGPYFKGHIYVVDGIWALKSVNLEILPSTLSFHSKFHLVHEYDKTQDGRWLIRREEYLYQVKEGKRQYYGHSLAFHRDYELDVDIPNRFFRNEVRKMEEEALDQDSSYWVGVRPIDLKKKELAYIKERDSILAYHSSAEYLSEQDSIYNHLNWKDFLLNGIQFRDRARGMDYSFDPIIAQIRPFGVGGYRHALGGSIKKNLKKGYDLRLRGEIDYGVTNEDVKGFVQLGYTYLPKKFARAYVRYGDVYDLVTVYENLATILSRSNFINHEYFKLGHTMEVFNGFFLDASASFSERRAINQLELSEWSQEVFGAENIPREFDDYREFLLDFKIRFTPGQKYKTLPYRKVILGSRWPTFFLRYKKSIPGVYGSELDFDFLELGARHEFDLGTFGHSKWVSYAGRFLRAKNLRFTDLKFIRGSDPFIFVAPLEFFQLLGPTFSTSNAYLQALYIHNFNGVLMDKIPLIKRTRLQSSVGGGILAIEDGNFLHGEIFAGLQYPLRILKTRIKLGVYYVVARSNYRNALPPQIKVGISFFNPVTNRWSH